MALDLEGGAAGGSSRPPRVSTLQPLNFPASLVAAYALNEMAAACNLDRSGNGRHFATNGELASEMMNVPDLIPGKGAIMSAPTGAEYATQPLDCAQHGGHWQLEGELTITFRWWILAPIDLVAHTPIYSNATPTGISSVAFQFSIAEGHKLAYYAERDKTGLLWISSLVVPVNRWIFVSLRRRADGSVRLGYGTSDAPSDQHYEDSPPRALPHSSFSGDAWFCRFANNRDASPTQIASGPIADFACWSRFFSDAELVPQYAAAMRGANGP